MGGRSVPFAQACAFLVLLMSASLLGAQAPDAQPSLPGPPAFPPPGTEPTEYLILATWDSFSGTALPLLETEPEGGRPPPPPVHDGMLIGTEEEYRAIFGEASEGIDWESRRVLVFQDLTVYKFGDLESSCSLAGICHSEGTTYVGRSFAQYGPMQGIAQQSEWFSYSWRTLLILIPREPRPIEYVNLGLDRGGYDIP